MTSKLGVSGNMLPCFAIDYEVNRYSCHIEMFGELQTLFASVNTFSNFAHLFLVQLGLMMPRAFKAGWVYASVFLTHILHVVFVCSQKQMVRIAAHFIVAMMKTMQSVRNCAEMKFIGNAVRVLGFPVDGYLSVSTLEEAGAPAPAFSVIEFDNVGPETRFEGHPAKTMGISVYRAIRGMILHVISSLLACDRAGDAPTSPGISIGSYSFIIPQEAS